MKKLKVGIIGIRGLPARYGAFDQFVDQFVEYSNFLFLGDSALKILSSLFFDSGISILGYSHIFRKRS